MRQFSANVQALLDTGEPSLVYCVEILNTGLTIRDTTAAFNITLTGIGTFTPNNDLLMLEAPRLSTQVDREAYKVAYADSSFEKISMFDNLLLNAQLTSRVVFFNTLDYTLGGAEPGQPLLEPADTIIAYSGIIDKPYYTINPDEGIVTAYLECASPMAALNMTKAFYTSKEGLHQRVTDDTAFDKVFEGSKKYSLLWGRAA